MITKCVNSITSWDMRFFFLNHKKSPTFTPCPQTSSKSRIYLNAVYAIEKLTKHAKKRPINSSNVHAFP